MSSDVPRVRSGGARNCQSLSTCENPKPSQLKPKPPSMSKPSPEPSLKPSLENPRLNPSQTLTQSFGRADARARGR